MLTTDSLRRRRNGGAQSGGAVEPIDDVTDPDTAVPSSAAISAQMRRTRRHGTAPELALRSELHRRGYRFRVQRPLPFDRRRKADIVFAKHGIVVFADGCFWHSCPEHATR